MVGGMVVGGLVGGSVGGRLIGSNVFGGLVSGNVVGGLVGGNVVGDDVIGRSVGATRAVWVGTAEAPAMMRSRLIVDRFTSEAGRTLPCWPGVLVMRGMFDAWCGGIWWIMAWRNLAHRRR